jgi:uncharacterized integral membrane protein
MVSPAEEPSSDLLPPAPSPAPGPSSAPRPLPGQPTLHPARISVPRTRTSAIWAGVWFGVVVLVLLIVFVAQNTASVQIKFLWMSGHFSLALALLVAGVAGTVIAMAVAAARIIQLRRLVKQHRD